MSYRRTCPPSSGSSARSNMSLRAHSRLPPPIYAIWSSVVFMIQKAIGVDRESPSPPNPLSQWERGLGGEGELGQLDAERAYMRGERVGRLELGNASVAGGHGNQELKVKG